MNSIKSMLQNMKMFGKLMLLVSASSLIFFSVIIAILLSTDKITEMNYISHQSLVVIARINRLNNDFLLLQKNDQTINEIKKTIPEIIHRFETEFNKLISMTTILSKKNKHEIRKVKREWWLTRMVLKDAEKCISKISSIPEIGMTRINILKIIHLGFSEQHTSRSKTIYTQIRNLYSRLIPVEYALNRFSKKLNEMNQAITLRIKRQAKRTTNILIVTILFALVLSYLVTWFISKLIVSPINTLVSYAIKVENGDISAMKPLNTNDEMGYLSGTLNEMIQSLNKTNILQLDKQNDFLHNVMESLTYPFFVLRSTDYSVKMANSAARDPFNASGFRYIHEIENLSKICKKIIDRKDSNIENIVLQNSARQTIYLEMYGFPIIDAYGDVSQIIVYFIDISDKETAFEQLRTTRNYLNQMINSIAPVIIATDEDGYITHWNNKAEEFIGFPLQKAISKKVFEILPFLFFFSDQFLNATRSGESFHAYKERINYNESYFYIDLSISPLIYSMKKGAVISFEDVTDNALKEQQLIQTQKMETVGNLAGGLAHDFNNILGGIIGTVSLMDFILMKDGAVPPDKLSEYLQVLQNCGNRASTIVQQLLTLSRKKEVEFTAVSIDRIINNVLMICRSSFDKCIEFDINNSRGKAITQGDQSQLEQVFLNLCVNASHAMTSMRPQEDIHRGILSINISLSENINLAKTPKDRSYWVVTISDTGVGMSQDILEKVFDPFFTTKDETKGTGLGLSMCYTIIQQHNGQILIESEPGKGSHFHVFLPCSGQETENGHHLLNQVIHGEGSVLVVDDEEVIREMAKQMLEECGYMTLLASEGESAISIFQKEHSELSAVLLDLEMPRLSGKMTFSKMHEIDPSVPVILTSGIKSTMRIKGMLDMGLAGVIHKPYSISDLSRVLHDVTTKKRKNNEN